MITIDQLDDIYQGPPDPPVKIPPVSLSSFNDAVHKDIAAKTSVDIGSTSPVDVEPYQKYLDEGVYSNRDINAVRGERQSAWDKWGNFVPRVIGKSVTNLVQGIGYMGALFSEWGDNKDYSNALTEAMDDANAKLDEALPIYRTGHDIWNWGDLGNWLNVSEGAISFLAPMALEGIGIAKLLGGVGKVTKGAEALEWLSGGTKAGQLLSRGLTAGALAYTEGAQMGKGVYDEVYAVQLQKGLAKGWDADKAALEAKKIASQSAATTVQINTALGTILNMYEVLPFFNHEEKVIEKLARNNFFQKSSESLGDWATRVKGYTIDNFKNQAFKGEGKLAMLRSSFMEGVEELTNDFAETTGKEEGKEGRTHGFLEQFGQLEKYFDRTMNKQGALDFILGAAMGPLTTAVTTNIPIHKVQVGYQMEEDGSTPAMKNGQPIPLYKVMTSHNKNKFGNTNYFNNIKDAIVFDIDTMQQKHDAIALAQASGNTSLANQLKNELFNVQTKRSVQLGFAENLKETYRQIASLDNTTPEREALTPQINALKQQVQEGIDTGVDVTDVQAQLDTLQQKYDKTPDHTPAMKGGFAKDVNDNHYKQKAERAIRQLDDMQKMHDDVMRKFGEDSRVINGETEDGKAIKIQLADMLFDRYANIHLMQEDIKEHQKRLDELSGEHDSLANVIGGDELYTFMREQEHYLAEHASQKARREEAIAEAKVLEEAFDNPDIANLGAAHKLIEKYGAIGAGDADLGPAMKATHQKLVKIVQTASQKLAENDEKIKNSSGFTKWQEANPNGTFDDYNKEINKKSTLSDEQRFLNFNIKGLQDRIDIQKENLAEVQQSRTMTKIAKATQKWWDKLAEERKKYNEQAATDDYNHKKDIDARKRMEYLNMKRQRNQALATIRNIKERIEQLAIELETVLTEMKQFENADGRVYMDDRIVIETYNEFSSQKLNIVRELDQLNEQLLQQEALVEKLNADIQAVDTGVAVTEEEKEDTPADDPADTSVVTPDPPVADPVGETPMEIPSAPVIEGQPEDISQAIPLSVEAEQVVAQVGTALEGYLGMLKQLPLPVQKQLKLYEQQLKLGEQEFSFNALSTFISVGVLDASMAAAALQSLKDYIDSLADDQENSQEIIDDGHTVAASVTEPDSIMNDVEAKKADIEKRRQEELNNRNLTENNTDGKWDIAADYLLTGGINTVISTDYLLLGIAGIFDKATGLIDNIRNQYAKELSDLNQVDIKNFVGTELYNKIINDIKSTLEKTYSNKEEAKKILDEILKHPTGSPNRIGSQINSRIDALNKEQESKINAKYDAELKALEQPTTSNQSKIETKKADIERRRQEELKNSITNKDKIVFGHPGLGKTYLRESGRTDVIDFDSDYKSRINKKFNLSEGFKARNDFQKSNKEEYQQAVRELWIEAKREAKKTGKQLFASDMILLREFASDFDKVITMPKETFIDRAKQRNDYTPGLEGTESWKNSLDAEIAKINKSKVINTTSYLSDLFQDKINAKYDAELATLPFESNPSIVKHDTNVINTIDVGNARLITKERKFGGKKTVDAAITVGGNDLQHDDILDPKDNTLKKVSGLEINPDTNTVVFDPAGLKPGTKLRLVVDDTYKGPKSNTKAMNTGEFGEQVKENEQFSDYTDADNFKILEDDEHIGNVPMKLVDQKGNTIRHIRTVRWIETTWDATQGPEMGRNVYDGSNAPGDVPPGNIARQAGIQLEIRKRIVEQYNNGDHSGVEVLITDKGAGTPIYNVEKSQVQNDDGETKWERASNSLPDTSLRIAISAPAGDTLTLYEGHNSPTEKDIATVLPSHLAHRAFVLLPAPNGQHHAALLKGMELTHTLSPLQTITRAIELHLLGDASHPDIQRIANSPAHPDKPGTGLDISTVKGLKAFINQFYTYTSEWSPDSYKGTTLDLLDIREAAPGNFNSMIKIIHQEGNGTEQYAATLENGKVNPKFVQALQQLLSKRLRNIVFTKPEAGVRGINEQTTLPFVEAKADKNGKWSFPVHKNYNEYIKGHVTTNIYGHNQVEITDKRGNKKKIYVYAVNPKLEYNAMSIIQSPKVEAAVDTTLPTPNVEPETTGETEEDIINSMLNGKIIIKNASTVDGVKVTIDNLIELRNLAGSNTNGKSIDEVYDYLTKSGIASLYKGFNPFIKCS